MAENDVGVWTEEADGCKEVVEWQNLELHSSTCPFALLHCAYKGCDETFLRKDKIAHLSRCEWRTSTCKKCDAEILSTNKSAHITECPYSEYTCVNGCGKSVFLKDKTVHLEKECAELVLLCPNSAFGCKHRCKKAELPKHLANNNCPFELFRPFFELTVKNIEALNDKISRQNITIENQQKEIDALRRTLYGKPESFHRSSSVTSGLSRSPAKDSSSPMRRKTSSSSNNGGQGDAPEQNLRLSSSSSSKNLSNANSYQIIEEEDSNSLSVRLSMNSI